VSLISQHALAGAAADAAQRLLGTAAGKVYFIGDSHSLPPTGQMLTIGGEEKVIANKLVTGLKCWHLRPEGVFYPKHQFDAVAASLPAGADCIFLFGEIDCREGILRAVEKGYHASAHAAYDAVVLIYVAKLLLVQKARKLGRVFVHSALPVLDVTRHLVIGFNKRLKLAVAKQKSLTFLDLTDRLLEAAVEGGPQPHKIATDAGEARVLKQEYVLDSTHISPSYVPGVLQVALDAALAAASS
jgi:hypothetical protein